MTTDFELNTDFSEEVLETSKQIPVLVDFWAEWCGPCRILGPILEKLAGEASGEWKLVKVNTELHPDLAQAFDLRGIPAVKLFSQGEPIAEFTGALPEAQVRDWLGANLPGASDDEFTAAFHAFETDDLETARIHLQRALAQRTLLHDGLAPGKDIDAGEAPPRFKKVPSSMLVLSPACDKGKDLRGAAARHWVRSGILA